METDDAWHQTDRLNAATGKGDPFAAAMRATRMPMIVTDPRLADNPIVFANDAFLKLTGYSREEVLKSNCRMLQGPASDQSAISAIREAVRERRDVSVDLLNYRKDGTTFWNALYVSPVFNEEGELLYFFASQLDVTDRKLAELAVRAAKEHFETEFLSRTAELQRTLRDLRSSNEALAEALATKTALVHEVDHRVKNNLQMISALVVMQSRAVKEPLAQAALGDTLSRIEALGTVHRRLYQSADVTHFDIGAFVNDLIGDLSGIGGGGRISIALDLETAVVPAEDASAIALIVNEVATNALKHAFPDGRTGTLTVTLRENDGRIAIGIADDGVGMQETGSAGSFGTSLINTLGKQLKADISWTPASPGTRFTMAVPRKRQLKASAA